MTFSFPHQAAAVLPMLLVVARVIPRRMSTPAPALRIGLFSTFHRLRGCRYVVVLVVMACLGRVRDEGRLRTGAPLPCAWNQVFHAQYIQPKAANLLNFFQKRIQPWNIHVAPPFSAPERTEWAFRHTRSAATPHSTGQPWSAPLRCDAAQARLYFGQGLRSAPSALPPEPWQS